MPAKRSRLSEDPAVAEPINDEPELLHITGRTPLDASTKIVIGALSLCGVVIVGLGIWLIGYRVSHPFNVTLQEVFSPSTSTAVTSQNLADLKQKDTDGDSLTDYDEIYIYGTSPYLPDTDSDGVNDGTEVKRGTDPNCNDQKGEKCTGVRFINPDSKISDLLPQLSPTNITLKDATLKQFRKILLDSGMSADNLATLDDQQLFVMMDAIVTADQQEPINVDNLDEQEIRDFLVAAGLSQDEVDHLSPDDLKSLIKSLL